ncbi:DUF7537 family lipoprotein [Halobacterium litoreum]|uniref:Lipoprotein n=1 Tax=Halobacterium litoreum TaxID=2039234 RepID=A0ABD5NCJ4_9EURY|nr:hypothetical protein [Halobacterium litoreum]UHH14105.1 hypothetical protein LT972_03670 [Halobacterium litoreum]
MRRQFATLAVVALVLVAGCAAGGGGDGATTAPGDESGDPLYETPLNASAVADAHLAALEDAGSYTVTSNGTQTVQNTTTETSSVARGDLSSGAVATSTATSQRTVDGFAFGNGTAYQRYQTGNETEYVDASGRMGSASQYGRGTVASYVTLFDFAYAGTTTENGETVHVYEAEGTDAVNASATAFRGLNESNFRSASATMHVREDGLVTRAGYDITVSFRGTEQRLAVTQRFSALGETTVEPPAWIDDARANTSSSS